MNYNDFNVIMPMEHETIILADEPSEVLREFLRLTEPGNPIVDIQAIVPVLRIMAKMILYPPVIRYKDWSNDAPSPE